eukprot:358897-Chlamydomonas_euryale.AAC.8
MPSDWSVSTMSCGRIIVASETSCRRENTANDQRPSAATQPCSIQLCIACLPQARPPTGTKPLPPPAVPTTPPCSVRAHLDADIALDGAQLLQQHTRPVGSERHQAQVG